MFWLWNLGEFSAEHARVTLKVHGGRPLLDFIVHSFVLLVLEYVLHGSFVLDPSRLDCLTLHLVLVTVAGSTRRRRGSFVGLRLRTPLLVLGAGTCNNFSGVLTGGRNAFQSGLWEFGLWFDILCRRSRRYVHNHRRIIVPQLDASEHTGGGRGRENHRGRWH